MRPFQLGELGGGRLRDGVQVSLPAAAVAGERSEAVDRGEDARVRSRVGLEVAFVAGEKVAALAGLGILEVRERLVDAPHEVAAGPRGYPRWFVPHSDSRK